MVLPVFYVLMTVGAVAAFLAIQAVGASLITTAGSNGGSPAPLETSPSTNLLMHVLLALAVIILVTRAMGAVFRFFHQPPVVGEIIGGIFLGPSILGRVLPDVQAYLLPPDIAPEEKACRSKSTPVRPILPRISPEERRAVTEPSVCPSPTRARPMKIIKKNIRMKK